MTQKLVDDNKTGCGTSSEIGSDGNDFACDDGACCGPSPSLNSGEKSLKSKIGTFFIYTIILAAIVVALISIFS